MTIEVDPDWWKTLFDEVYLLTDARSVDDARVTPSHPFGDLIQGMAAQRKVAHQHQCAVNGY